MLPWIVLLCLSLDLTSGFLDIPVDYPNPRKQWRMCGRQRASYVCDPEFILERGEVDKLDLLAQEMSSSTCLCPSCPDAPGVQIGIYVKNNVTQESYTDVSGKTMAETITKEWNLGTCDDDIVIVLFTHSNISGFSLGTSVQGLLSEETATIIFTDCRFHFDSGYFYQGLESIVNSFHDIIVREQKNTPKSHRKLLFGLLIGFTVLLLVVGGILSVVFRQKRRRKKSCSTIYDRNSKRGEKRLPSDSAEQLEKLNKKSETEEV